MIQVKKEKPTGGGSNRKEQFIHKFYDTLCRSHNSRVELQHFITKGVCFYRCGNVYVGQTLGPCVLFTDIIEFSMEDKEQTTRTVQLMWATADKNKC
jgi:hypothetical protein